jgi:putative hydrolase of the HAD superfamily
MDAAAPTEHDDTTTRNQGVRGIFFDLDDTLIGYAEAERRALLAGCALASHVNPAVDADALAAAIYDAYEQRYAYGTPGYAELARIGVADFRRLLTEDALRTLGLRNDPNLVGALVDAYETAEQEALLRFPDAEETLRRLRPYVRLGLITNGPSAMQRAKLAALALDGYFDVIVIDTEFGHPKPDARIFEHAARQVGLAPSELLFVGNSLAHDIAGARRAGWTAVWLREAGAGPLHPTDPVPDHTIGCLSELLALPRVVSILAPPPEAGVR